MNKLKVLQIIDTLNVGGAEMLAVNISNALANKGIESHICTTRKEGELKDKINNNVGYLFLGKRKTIDLKAIIKLSRYVKHNDIHILHAHSPSYFIAICVKLVRPKTKIVWHDHFGGSEFLTDKSRKTLQMVSFLFSSVIAVNSKLLEWSKRNLKAKNYNFLNNFAVFDNDSPQTYLKGEEGKRIVHVAGFREQKDHITLLKAFSILLKVHPEWTLHLIGKVHEGVYSETIKNYILENNLSNSVFIYGVCTDIKHILKQSTIGVLASKSEGLPISLLEYGLAQLPVLVTDVGECANVVTNSKAVTPSENSEKFARSLLEIIENKNIRNDIALELSEAVIKGYSVNTVTNKLVEIYNKI
ncbi:MAG: glycosyltransferase [Flavobacteriaceae bacterium]|nr:glycosyltransferase [Flavobacteriaceae bacterium]